MFQDEIIELQQKYASWLEAKCGFGSVGSSPLDVKYIYLLERWAEQCQ